MYFKLLNNAYLSRLLRPIGSKYSTLSSDVKLSYTHCDVHNLNLIGKTVVECFNDKVSEKPNEIAYKFCLHQQNFTFIELKQRVDEIAQNLLNMGFKKGDRLSIMLPNIPEFMLTSLACASIGVISALMNPAYQLVEIEYMLKKTQSKGIVIMDNFKSLKHYENLSKICPELESTKPGELKSVNLPDLKHVIVANLDKKSQVNYRGTWNFDRDLKKFNGNVQVFPHIDLDDMLAMIFTSGTTGLPKVATIRNHTAVNSSFLEHHYPGCSNSNRIVCIPIPLFHIFGYVIGALSTITNGNQTVFPNILPDTLSTMKSIQNEKCTSLKGAPVIFHDIINHPERPKYDLSSLESMLIGASVVPKDLLLKIKKDLNLKHVIVGYGMTETGSVGSLTRCDDIQKSEKFAYETIGKGFPHVEAKIIDPISKKITPRNTDGELCLRGYNIMTEYWDDPVKTAESIDKNGWFYTGDICSMDEHGYLYFKSRAKEIVIRGGVNIYPAEVERFLRTNEKVLECFVVGVPDERFGEELCAWVKLKSNNEMNEKELKDFCKDKIAYFKIPKYVKFVDSFPINATGKVQKFKMVEQMKNELKLN
ncbi:unnamed protein product [Brachionus calyciflorus]|uniref:Medium-chain acyl-CoA ligase ACSF2, mitochondrial n=1 Tax=Brachionus calyciflorus TaxID=104777 RepID=A0A814EZW8_9BILA|nr:unnamed protein product [Brachionus calyciflorus]